MVRVDRGRWQRSCWEVGEVVRTSWKLRRWDFLKSCWGGGLVLRDGRMCGCWDNWKMAWWVCREVSEYLRL